MVPYQIDFLVRERGFDGLPPEIDLTRLYNVSFDLSTGEVKLYVLDRSGTFLHKIGRDGITRQYEARAGGADPSRLARFLGARFDWEEIVVDTVEDEVWYLLIEGASASEFVTLMNLLCARYGVPKARLVESVNRINRVRSANLQECWSNRAVSGVKVPFAGEACKLYARPFLTGNGFDLGERAEAFLCRLYGCSREELPGAIRFLWVASELTSDRLVITTQDQHLRF